MVTEVRHGEVIWEMSVYFKHKNHPGAQMTMPEKVGPGLAMGKGQRISWEDTDWDRFIEGGLKAYPLLSSFSSFCACKTPRFDVDDYGRLYIPNALTCSVQVVDNEGNEIMKFGDYGNFDSQGPESGSTGSPPDTLSTSKGKSPKPAIPTAYPMTAKVSFKHIYVADEANRRVVRVDPTWKAEETCEVK
jgi:hypothetical protein